jgi:hypothetical protein
MRASPEPKPIMEGHARPLRAVASPDGRAVLGGSAEAVPAEDRCDPGKQVAGMARHRRIYRVALSSAGASVGGHTGSGLDHGSCHAVTAVLLD